MNQKALLSTAFLLFFTLLSLNLSAQQRSAPECGFDHVHEELAKENPEYRREMEEYLNRVVPLLSDMQSDNGRGFNTLYVPVVVHIIHAPGEAVGTGSNLTVERIQAQIDVLNEDFSATNSEYSQTPARWQGVIGNPDIQFCLAAIDPSGQPTNGITRDAYSAPSDATVRDVIKPATWWNSALYYNIWTVPIPGTDAGGGTTGYAYFPNSGTIGSSIDGSVVDWRWFGGPGTGASGWRTLTHEVGHSFGLPHPFSGNSCSADDGIADTPNQAGPTSDYVSMGCSGGYFTGPMSCGEEHMYVNYMDYSRGSCKTSFSQGQINVMRAVLKGETTPFGYGSREALVSNSSAVCTFYDNDASISAVHSPTGPLCDNNDIAPVVTLTNLGILELTTAKIRYTINNGTPIETIWIDNLEPGASTVVTLNSFTPPAGSFDMAFYPVEPNGVVDELPENDTSKVAIAAITPQPLPLIENFGTTVFNPTASGLYVVNPQGDSYAWEREAFISSDFGDRGSVSFNNYNAPASTVGRQDYLVSQTYDFSGVNGALLSFDVGYAPYDNGSRIGNDTLAIIISTDCSVTFDQVVYKKGGEELATKAASDNLFFPFFNDWRRDTVDLSAFDGMNNVTLVFVNISDRGNRMIIDQINLETPASSCSLTITPTVAEESCLNTCDGEVSLVVDGGTPPYEFLWGANAGASTNAAIDNLCADDYSVTVTDQEDCTAEMTITISAATSISLVASSTTLDCNGDSDGIISVMASGGSVAADYQYLWSDPSGQTTATAVALSGGTYTVTVTDDNDCTATIPVEVSEPAAINLSADATDVACNGDGNGSATVVASGGNVAGDYQYLWSDPSGQTTATATGLSVGSYTVTVTDDNDCTQTTSVDVSEPAVISLNNSESIDLTCNGDANGSAIVIASGGTVASDYQYLWSDPSGQTTAAAVGLSGGTYTVTVTDDNDCTAETSFIIEEPTAIGLSISATDVQCNGSADGTATVVASGGTVAADYQYLWSDPSGQTTATATGLAGGPYTVTVTDDNNCTAAIDVTVSSTADIQLSVVASDLNCNGDANASASANASGGTVSGDYQYLWSDPAGQTTATATGLTGGTYTVTVTDDNNCSVVDEVTVNEPEAITGSDVISHVLCFGSSDGEATITPAGGTGPYTYNIGLGSTNTPVFTGLAAGIYTVTITDANLCTGDHTWTIDEPATLSLTSELINPNCSDDTGCVTWIGDGGTSPYLYNIGAGNTSNPKFAGLGAGTYTVTVTDNNGCSSTDQVVVDAPPAIELSLSNTDVGCEGDNNGTATVVATGGTVAGNYQYLWSDPAGQSSPTAVGLSAGIYTVTVTDDNDCTVSSTVTVGSPPALGLTTSSTDETGVGSSDGTATAMPSGGTPTYTYAWSDPAAQSSMTATGLAAGSYTVTVTDGNGCTITSIVSINSFSCGSYSLTRSKNDVLCNGEAQGSATVDPQNGNDPYEYVWSIPGQMGPTVSGLTAGTYTVTVTDDSGCSLVEEFVITEPTAISLSTSATDETVAGNNDGTATATASGGTGMLSYQWSDPSMQSTSTATGLAPGTYTVTITDENDCTATDMVVVNEGIVNCSGFETGMEHIDVTCNGDADGSITVSPAGGTDPYQYNWSITNPNSPTANGLAAGTYTVTITDDNDCSLVETIIITEPTAIAISTSSTDETMAGNNDGTATATGSGGTGTLQYQWSDPSMQGTSTATGLAPGTYTVTVTDENNCTETATVVVNAGGVNCSSLDASMEQTNVNCNGENNGSVTVSPSGGVDPYQYNWSITNPNSPTANGLAAGTYTVTITDDNDCVIVETITITEPPAIALSASSTDETMAGNNDGTATAVGSGGSGTLNYQWSDPSMQSTSTATGLAPGTYTVTVTDENDCTETATVTVNAGGVNCSSLDASMEQTNVDCNGESNGSVTVSPSGGADPYQYNWSITNPNSPTANGLAAGTYTVTITDDNDCVIVETITITEPPAIALSASSTDETMAGNNDGTATATGSGGTGTLNYQWSDPSMQSTSTATGLAPGTYTVTVTDENDCTETATVIVNAGGVNCSSLDASMEQTNVDCNGQSNGSVTVSPSGGADPYQYNWSVTNPNSPTANGLAAGTYTVTITDDNDCVIIETITITEPPAIEIMISSTDETMAGSNDGTAMAVASGGTGTLTYAWSNLQIGQNISGLAPGTYTVGVIDENNCTANASITILAAGNNCAGFDGSASGQDIVCNGEDNGQAEAAGSGGADPYQYAWSNSQSGPVITGLQPGTYTVTITDDNGCTTIKETTISEPPAITLMASATDETAMGANDGTTTASASGGVGTLTYLWSTGLTSMGLTGLSAGTYTVTVTDRNGCTKVESVMVNTGGANCAGFGTDVESNIVSCFGASDGSATATGFGGTEPYVYNWSNSQSGETINGLSAGEYTVTITDANDCVSTETIIVTQPSELRLTLTGADGNCGSKASAFSALSGGTAPYDYEWSNGGTDDSIDELDAGTYTLTITDANNCTATEEVSVEVGSGGIDADAAIGKVTCFGENDGFIDLELLAGMPPFTFDWNNGETTEDIDSLGPGNYTVFIMDSEGCSYLTTFIVSSPAEMGIDFTKLSPTTGNNGQIIANAFGGTPPYSYNWSTGSTGVSINNLSIGSYSLTITDGLGCMYSDTTDLLLVGLAELETLTRFELYPNPTRDQFRLLAEFDGAEDVEVSLYNIVGQEVYRRNERTSLIDWQLNLADYGKGTYLLRLRTPDGQMVKRVVKIE